MKVNYGNKSNSMFFFISFSLRPRAQYCRVYIHDLRPFCPFEKQIRKIHLYDI